MPRRLTTLHIAWLLVALFMSVSLSVAQQGHVYNLSTVNGMPTNYVYSAITDKWGYLWMATEKGVVKYNGYSLKVFSYADGLTNEDIYGLQKDARGRIWLYGFSGKLGNIYNDRYTELKNYTPYALTRVHYITPYKNDILFSTPIGLFAARNDSVIYLRYAINMINRRGEAFIGSDTGISKFRIDGYAVTRMKHCYAPIEKAMYGVPFGRYILYHSRSSDKIRIFDPENCSIQERVLYDEEGNVDTIWYATYNDTRKILALAKKNIYEIDTNFNASRVSVSSIVGGNADLMVLNYLNDSLWGQCLSTRFNGLYIRYPRKEGLFARSDVDLRSCKPVGTIDDSISYWWNASTRQLTRFCNGKAIVRRLEDVSHISRVSRFNSKYAVVFGVESQLLNNSSLETEKPVSGVFRNGRIFPITGLLLEGKFFPSQRFTIPASSIFTDSLNGFTTVHMILHRMVYLAQKSLMSMKPVDSQACQSLFYDTSRGIVVACGEAALIHHVKSGKNLKIPMSYLNRAGVRKIVNLLFAPSLNRVFVQDHDALFYYDLRSHRFTRVLNNLNLENAKLSIKDERLVVAGKFGLMVGSLADPTLMTDPRLYQNIKEQYYSEITGMQIVGDTLQLNTDRGLYTMSLSRFSAEPISNKYKLIANYNDSLFSIKAGDTIRTTQLRNRILYDVVNAYGSGRLRFSYRISSTDSAWTRLVANEMVVPNLKPGEYHKIYLSLADDVWNSNPIPLYFYIEPYWWQTKAGRNGIWAGGILLLSGLLFSVYGVTRSVINRNNQKRNKLLELEVKSVYAQINPHFIFNSLNSALSYIELNRNEEAHSHISRFSGLLRGFIKSSRNRYTTIGEELQNLKNYIELEQNRFANSFTYEIVVPPQLEAESIPTLLLQPLVENAINHGLLPKEEGGHLAIRFEQNGKDLVCIIEDNGIGRKRSRELREQHSPRVSYGSLLIYDLIDVFNKYEKTKIDITYTDKAEPDTGLIVTLTFKKP